MFVCRRVTCTRAITQSERASNANTRNRREKQLTGWNTEQQKKNQSGPVHVQCMYENTAFAGERRANSMCGAETAMRIIVFNVYYVIVYVYMRVCNAIYTVFIRTKHTQWQSPHCGLFAAYESVCKC